MAKTCHQCRTKFKKGGRRGPCSICSSSNVWFCPTCAMWELGPRDEPLLNLPRELKKGAKSVIEVQRQKSTKSKDNVSTVNNETPNCRKLLRKLGRVCPVIKDQRFADDAFLYGVRFKVQGKCEGYVCRALSTFDRLYPSCRHDRLMMKILLVFHLSTQERVQCRDAKDAKADSTRANVQFTHRWDTRALAAVHFRKHSKAIEKQFGRRGLFGTDDAPALALGWNDIEFFMKGLKHITLAGIDLLALCGGDKKLAKKVLEIGVILYHVLTAVRTCDEIKAHWSDNPQGGFHPRHGLGYLSKEHFKDLYDKEGSAQAEDFTTKVQRELNRLYTVLDDVGRKERPYNQLPKHPRFPDAEIAMGLDPVVTDYLQYLPTFDHPASQKKQRSECEQTVRTRVERQVRDVLGWRTRRSASKLLDKLYVEMRNDFRVDQAFDTSVANILKDCIANHRSFEPKGWFPVFARDIPFSEVFPDCGFGNATFVGVRKHYEDTRNVVGVTSGRPAHYLDWRNAKDNWLYDGFPLPLRQRPVFSSLSAHPFVPEPNSNYGHHVFLYKPDRIRGRFVLTLGDKQQPCRSMLLLLDRVLFSYDQKDGSEPQGADNRLEVFSRVIERHQAIEADRGKTIAQIWQGQLAKKMVPSLGADYLFECQIFGGIDLDTDLAGIVLTSHDVAKYNVPMAGVPNRADVDDIRTWAGGKNIPVLEFEYVLHRQMRQPSSKSQYAPLTVGKKAPKRVKLLGKSPGS